MCFALGVVISASAQTSYVVEQRNLTELHMGYHERGYRGFFEISGVVGMTTDYGGGDKAVSMSTSHGWQISPYAYLGVGVGFDRHLGERQDITFFPVFLDARMNILDTRISPYIGLRAGYSFGKNTGVYAYPSVGLSLGVTKRFGFDVALGYSIQSAEFYKFGTDDYLIAHCKGLTQYHEHYQDVLDGNYTKFRELLGGFTLRIGVSF